VATGEIVTRHGQRRANGLRLDEASDRKYQLS